ncbi:MAG: hypothetical protein AB1442_02200 [Nitrospirota bacterium]
MVKIYYDDKNILKTAFAAIDADQALSIIVTGWSARILRRTLPMYIKYFYDRELRNEKKKKAEILRFVPLGIFTPTFWGIVNKATMRLMFIKFEEKNHSLVVQFTPHTSG